MNQEQAFGALIGLAVTFVILTPFVLLAIISGWKLFAKAGQPGWAILIPIYNSYIWIKMAGRPGWWLLLLLIPFVSFVVAIILCLDIAKAFGKGGGFAILMILLPIIAIPILAFGSATYTKPERIG